MRKSKNNKNMKKEQRFIKVVIRRMTKAGFDCKMMDRRFVVIKDGRPFEVEMWNAPIWWKRRVHFNLTFAFEGMDQVMPEALMWLASESNNHSNFTVTRLLRDHFSCCVETVVCTAKEFVREFEFAYKQIGNAYMALINNYDEIKEEYREKPTPCPIGFLADRYMQEVKEMNECKLVARTYSTFAGKTNTNH